MGKRWKSWREIVLAASVVAAGGMLGGCPAVGPLTQPALTQPAAGVAELAPEVGSPPLANGIFVPVKSGKLDADAAGRVAMSRAQVLAEARRTAVVPLTTQPATQPSVEPPPLAVKFYLQGREKFMEGARTEAMELLTQSLRLDPHAFTVLRLMGRVCFVNNKLASGSRYLLEAHRIHPQDVEVAYLLGRYFAEQKEWITAIAYLGAADESRERVPQSVDAAKVSFELARAMHSGGYYTAAAAEFEEFLAQANTPVAAYRYDRELSYVIDEKWAVRLNLAEDYVAAGAYAKALPHYRAAMETSKNDQYVISRMAAAQAKAGEADGAIRSALRLVMASNASDPSVALLLWVYRQSGREGQIVEDLSKRAQGTDHASAAILALAGVQEKLGNKAAALAALQQYITGEPGDAGVVDRLVRLAKSEGKPEAAFMGIARAMGQESEKVEDLRRAFYELVGDKPAAELVKKFEAAAATGSPATQARAAYLLGLLAQRQYEQSHAEAELSLAVKLDPTFWPAREAYVLSLLSGDQFVRATAVVREAIEEKQGGVKAFTLQIDSEALQGRYASALRLAEDARNRFPDSAEVWLELVNIYRGRGQQDLAAKELAALIAQFPRNEEAYQRAIEMALARRDVETAFATLDRLLTQVPASRFGLTLTAQLYARQGRAPEAEQLLRRLVSEKPEDADAVVALASVLRDQNKDDEAVKALQTALTAKPTPALAEGLAQLYHGIGREAEAMKLVERMWKEHPDSETWLSVYVSELLAQDKKDDAEAALRQGLGRFPRSASVVSTLCRLLSNNEKSRDAIGLMEKFNKENGVSAERLYLLSHLYNDVGEMDKSTAVLERVLEINPDHTGANNDLGYFWSDQGKHLVRAEALVRKAIDNVPNNAAFVDSLGWIYYKQGRFVEAAEQLRRSTALPGGKEPEVYSHLGDALYRAGKHEEAIGIWRAALAMYENVRGTVAPEKLKFKQRLQKQIDAAEANKEVELAPTAPKENGASATSATQGK